MMLYYNILAYLQPTNDLFLKVAAERPVAVYSYDVQMHRKGINPMESNKNIDKDRILSKTTQETNYPFVPRGVGPVELQDYFGH